MRYWEPGLQHVAPTPRVGGLALILGAIVLFVITGLLEALPDLHRLLAAFVVLPVSGVLLFIGVLSLSWRLRDVFCIAAFVSWFVAFMPYGGDVFSDLVSPSLHYMPRRARELADNPGSGTPYGHPVAERDRTRARSFLIETSAAIALWSISIVKGRALPRFIGLYGIILGPASILAVRSPGFKFSGPAFGWILLGQTVWLVAAGTGLLLSDAGDE